MPALKTLALNPCLCRFAKSDKSILKEFNNVDAFGRLLKAAEEVSEQHAEMPAAEITAMYIALAQFTASVYPDRLDFVDLVLTSCYRVFPWSYNSYAINLPGIHHFSEVLLQSSSALIST